MTHPNTAALFVHPHAPEAKYVVTEMDFMGAHDMSINRMFAATLADAQTIVEVKRYQWLHCVETFAWTIRERATGRIIAARVGIECPADAAAAKMARATR